MNEKKCLAHFFIVISCYVLPNHNRLCDALTVKLVFRKVCAGAEIKILTRMRRKEYNGNIVRVLMSWLRKTAANETSSLFYPNIVCNIQYIQM